MRFGRVLAKYKLTLPHTSNEIWTYNPFMRFALSNDERIEATKGAKGVCPCCGNDLVAKCGEIVIHHWSHKKKCDDHW